VCGPGLAAARLQEAVQLPMPATARVPLAKVASSTLTSTRSALAALPRTSTWVVLALSKAWPWPGATMATVGPSGVSGPVMVRALAWSPS
jgi:hypothetical protein